METIRMTIEELQLENIMKLSGEKDLFLKLIEKSFGVIISVHNNEIVIEGDSLQIIKAKRAIEELLGMILKNIEIQDRDVIYICNLVHADIIDKYAFKEQKPIGRTHQGKLIFPKTIGQRQLQYAMDKQDIVFALGVAGTGKTYLAVVYAISLLKNGDVEKIILTRPAVEAGENLGFLPGDLKEKVDPYLRPLYDALYDMLGKEKTEMMMEKEVIEIAPLAYMRGRTLNNAFIILDEAQNTTKSQMKMFLTRMGFHSKIVITGDITQIDLIKKRDSGLLDAKILFQDMEDVGFVELQSLDVVRHPLVQKIIERYEEFEKEEETKKFSI